MMSGQNTNTISKAKNPLIMVGRITDEEYEALRKFGVDFNDWYDYDGYWYSPKTTVAKREKYAMYNDWDTNYPIFRDELDEIVSDYEFTYESSNKFEKYYWFKCPNGQTIKIAKSDLPYSPPTKCKSWDSSKYCSSCYCTHSNCVHYRRAVLTKYTPHARLFAHIDIEHIINYHYEQLFDLPHYGPEHTNYQNLPKWQ